jgi:hypothetical protein
MKGEGWRLGRSITLSTDGNRGSRVNGKHRGEGENAWQDGNWDGRVRDAPTKNTNSGLWGRGGKWDEEGI